MEPLQTDRLMIRNFRTEDWQDLLEFAVQYQASDVAQYDHPWPTHADGIKGAISWFATGDDFLAVCLRSTGKLIGFVCLNPSGDGSGEERNLGYGLTFDYHGAGYATEACGALLERAFADARLARVVTGTAEANRPSCRLLARLGFHQEQQSTGSLQTDADGKPVEFVGGCYAVTREGFDAARKVG